MISENQKFKVELINLKNENERLKNEIDELKNEIQKLNNELFKANKIISNFSKNNVQENINMSNNFNEILKVKDKEISDLKIKLQTSIDKNSPYVNMNKIIFVHFISMDQNVNCGIKCLETDTFAEVEERLYQKYEKYRETNNNFLFKGKIILRFKKICENNIKDGDKIQLIDIQ